MVSAPLYRALYVLVHALFSVYRWLVGAHQGVGGVFVDFCHEFGGFLSSNYQKTQAITKKKIPKHLTVLLGKEQPSYNDLANIVMWCIEHQIVYLSFYDYKGILKKHQDKLEAAITKILPSTDHVIWHNNNLSSTYKNGFLGRKIHIKVMSGESGKQAVVKVARNISKSSISSSDISINSVDEALRKDYEFPDPELGINCGEYLDFYGYPPWQIRVTEFLSLKSHHRLKYRTFLQQLHIYGKCEQRLGK